MVGTKAGGIKASLKNKKLHGEDFYKRIGHLGGIALSSKPKGFASNPALAIEAGRKGGRISKRGKAKHEITK